jgi:hypothetical protein
MIDALGDYQYNRAQPMGVLLHKRKTSCKSSSIQQLNLISCFTQILSTMRKRTWSPLRISNLGNLSVNLLLPSVCVLQVSSLEMEGA